MGLISLVYVSLAIRDMSAEELTDILSKARQNNQRYNITGMLLYRDRYFIQDLEGEEEAVMDIYHRIQDDPRHDHLVVVAKEPIQARNFADWSMGFTNLHNLNPEDYPGFTDFLTQPFEPEALHNNPNRARALLEAFREQTYY